MKGKFLLLVFLLLAAFCADLVWGSVSLPLHKVWAALIGNEQEEVIRQIVFNYRLPKALTALWGGAALSVAGVLMQTLFRNPLAGPDVLGVTSGATLGVALLTLGSGVLPGFALSAWGHSAAAILGASVLMLAVLLVSLRISHTVTLLIVGIMFGYFTSSVVSILQSTSNPDTLKLFITWTFGSLSSVGWEQLQVLCPLLLLGFGVAFGMHKSLNVLLLGDYNAVTMGVSVFRVRCLVIVASSLLAGAVTAFTGPIAFIGVTMPHIARGIFRTADHRILLPASFLTGSITLLWCDLFSQLPSQPLPLNAITALFGAPILIYIILRKQ